MLQVCSANNAPQTDSSTGGESPPGSAFPQYFLAATLVLGITLVAFLLAPLVGHRAVALIYLLGVVLIALFVRRGPTLLAATLSALCWDFFFLAPITHFRIANAEDVFMFGMYFVEAFVLGELTSRIRDQAREQRRREEHATALYRLTHELVEAISLDQLAQKVVAHLEGVFQAQVSLLLPSASLPLGYQAHPASTYEITGPEQPVAAWVLEQGHPAGRFTQNLPQADAMFVPLLTSGLRMGVVGLCFRQPLPPTLQQRMLLEAFAQQVALALDRHRLREESAKASLLAESERLSKSLLNSMSHEFRTPLAAIQSAASNLVEVKEPELSAPQQAMVAEIQEAADRLNGLLGKVLDITRLESGRVQPEPTWCDVPELVRLAVKETRKVLSRHRLEIDLAPNLPLVRLDFVLTQQALMNLLSNAAMHTPPGTSVQISAHVREGSLLLAVADRGPGIPPESLPRVFEKFYRCPNAPTGGTGLGLSLVKGFISAQRGEVHAENRAEGGALFTIRLPLS